MIEVKRLMRSMCRYLSDFTQEGCENVHGHSRDDRLACGICSARNPFTNKFRGRLNGARTQVAPRGSDCVGARALPAGIATAGERAKGADPDQAQHIVNQGHQGGHTRAAEVQMNGKTQ